MKIERERAQSFYDPGRGRGVVHMGCLSNAKEFQRAFAVIR